MIVTEIMKNTLIAYYWYCKGKFNNLGEPLVSAMIECYRVNNYSYDTGVKKMQKIRSAVAKIDKILKELEDEMDIKG